MVNNDQCIDMDKDMIHVAWYQTNSIIGIWEWQSIIGVWVLHIEHIKRLQVK